MRFQVDQGFIEVGIPDRQALEEQIARRLAARQGFALATLNLDHLAKLADNPQFLVAYRLQDLVVADGNPVVWLSRLAGRPVALQPGADMVVALARLAVSARVPVALVGSTGRSLAGAADVLRARVPGLEVALCLSPAFGFDPAGPEADRLLAQVRDSGARLCFLALGAPKQEILAARGRCIAPMVGFASIGAGLDFLSGAQKRAPRWVRQLALEWLWRMLSQPRRLAGRYLRCAAILPGHMARALGQRFGG